MYHIHETHHIDGYRYFNKLFMSGNVNFNSWTSTLIQIEQIVLEAREVGQHLQALTTFLEYLSLVTMLLLGWHTCRVLEPP